MRGHLDASSRNCILALLARYGRCADRLPTAGGWQDCFVDDAVLTSFSPLPDRPPAVITGRAAIERAFTTADASYPTIHVTANLVIERDNTGAVLRSAFIRFDRFADGTVVVGSFGRYRDRAVSCRDGLWRFSEREIHLISRRLPATRHRIRAPLATRPRS